jgi:hypothetical protein
MTASENRGEQLDAANRATFRKHYRDVIDKGIGDHEGSALAAILADLRANAEAAYGEAPKRAAGKS